MLYEVITIQTAPPPSNPEPEQAEKLDIRNLTIDQRACIVAALQYQVRTTSGLLDHGGSQSNSTTSTSSTLKSGK